MITVMASGSRCGRSVQVPEICLSPIPEPLRVLRAMSTKSVDEAAAVVSRETWHPLACGKQSIADRSAQPTSSAANG